MCKLGGGYPINGEVNERIFKRYELFIAQFNVTGFNNKNDHEADITG